MASRIALPRYRSQQGHSLDLASLSPEENSWVGISRFRSHIDSSDHLSSAILGVAFPRGAVFRSIGALLTIDLVAFLAVIQTLVEQKAPIVKSSNKLSQSTQTAQTRNIHWVRRNHYPRYPRRVIKRDWLTDSLRCCDKDSTIRTKSGHKQWLAVRKH